MMADAVSAHGRKRRWPRVVAAAVAVVVVAVAVALFVLPLFLGQPVVAASQIVVARGDVSTVAVGTGTIAQDVDSVYLLSGVTVREVYVAAGDQVEAGEVIATLDRDSIIAAQAETQRRLATVETKLSDAADGTVETVYIDCDVEATVIAINAAYGDSATEVVAANGALMVLELDSGAQVRILGEQGCVSGVWVSVGERVYPGYTLMLLDMPAVSEPVANMEAERDALILRSERLSSLLGDGRVYSTVSGEVTDVLIGPGLSVAASNDDDVVGARGDEGAGARGDEGADKGGGILADGPVSEAVALTQGGDAYDLGVALRVASDSTYRLTAKINELDIADLRVGHSVTVECDAIAGGFPGTVVEVFDSADAVSGGGFSAVVRFERVEGMKVGMSATATIIKDEKTDVPLVPLEAVHERNGLEYVFTTVDEQGAPAGETQIITGLSDGSSVEVTDGIDIGQTIYYTRVGSMEPSDDYGGFGPFPGMGGRGESS
jgi:multidrug efflux pump subunit AcrA (membrane-fusion protein)